MSYYPPVAGPILAANLASTAIIGASVPAFTMGIAIGVSLWLPSISVLTVDAGALGSGKGTLPLAVPQPTLLGFLMESFLSMGLVGVMAPLKILGLANGFTATLPSAIISTTNSTVGLGIATAKFIPPLAIPFLLAGFAATGITGTQMPRVATAIGLALTKSLAALVLPVPIIGSGSPAAMGAGTGFGKVV